MTSIIAPSLLASDFGNLQRDIEMVNQSEADWFHVDIMDGLFVPNISFGMPVVEAINKYAKKPLDVHLMIVQPERYIDTFHQLGASSISVHIEACPHLHRIIHHIKSLGIKAGVALNPHTSIDTLVDIIDDVDIVNLMSVNPGFGGQKFIPRTLDKIRHLRAIIDSKNLNCLIEIDGGVALNNYEEILHAGANVLVAGNCVFGAKNPHEVIATMKAFNRK
ncbi:MAG: ribulose-phosphate 3-epimerase [Cytophagales bacterium]|nr:MAG: ribulose-phosphate 3-epimerase [Cytophagales bacterium]